jgi:hypothetical protein
MAEGNPCKDCGVGIRAGIVRCSDCEVYRRGGPDVVLAQLAAAQRVIEAARDYAATRTVAAKNLREAIASYDATVKP